MPNLDHRTGWHLLAFAAATVLTLLGQVTLDVNPWQWRVLIVGAASAAPPPEPPGGPEPSGAGAPIKVLSYNAYGAVRTPRMRRVCTRVHGQDQEVCDLRPELGHHFDGVDDDQFRFVDVLADRIADEQPQLVALQEMCGSQVTHLERALASRGYPMMGHFVGDSHPDARCPAAEGRWSPQSVGKAILTQGPHTPDRHSPIVNVCVRYESEIPIRFCSVHTKPEKDGGSLESVVATLNGLAEQGAVIAAGDFNAEPDDPEMDAMYSNDAEDPHGRGRFYEADMADPGFRGPGGELLRYDRGGQPTHSRAKIDYVFADADSFNKEEARAWVEDTGSQCGGEACSDHRMVWATLHLRQQDPRFVSMAGTWEVRGEGYRTELVIGGDGSMTLRLILDAQPSYEETWRGQLQAYTNSYGIMAYKGTLALADVRWSVDLVPMTFEGRPSIVMHGGWYGGTYVRQ